MKPFFVYILRCQDNALYVGHTDDLEKRLREHGDGGFCKFTSSRRPVRLVHFEEFGERIDALEREWQIKRWSRIKKEALIGRDVFILSTAARGRVLR